MKAKVIETGEIAEAKRFKDMTDEEKKSTCIAGMCKDEDLFIEPETDCETWRYMFDFEVEILKEDETDEVE